MSMIILYVIVMIGVFIWGGYGLSSLLLTKKNSSYTSIWLVPWVGILYFAVSLTILSLMGITGQISTIIAIMFVSGVNIFIFVKRRSFLSSFAFPNDYVIGVIVLASLVFNLLIYFLKYRFPTTISLGNNDIIAYVSSADYLVKGSILSSFVDKTILNEAGTLLHGPYRWGISNITAMFGSILRVSAYQFTYILEVVVYSLMLPLVYEFFSVIYKRSLFGLLLSIGVIAFNVNLLYILYHNFFGQVFFWGASLFLYILLFPYIRESVSLNNRLNKIDYILGFVFSAIFLSYHEPVIFILLPIILYLMSSFFLNRDKMFAEFRKFCKIGLVTFVVGSISILHNFFFDCWARFGGIDKSAPLGWPPFRQNMPYANPIEILGFFSIHSHSPLPLSLAIGISLIIVVILVIGILSSRYRLLLTSFIIVFVFFLIISSVFEHNYFDYNRIVTYVLPLLGAVFAGGCVSALNILTNLLKKHFGLQKLSVIGGYILILLLFSTEVFWATKLFIRLKNEHLVVDEAVISLAELAKLDIKENIYTENAIYPVPYWETIWEDYFLFGNQSHLTKGLQVDNFENKYSNLIPENGLLLSRKSTPWVRSLNIIFSEILWENEYYKLGTICNVAGCLEDRKENLSMIEIGTSEYEDSLLLSGWSTPEYDGRWANRSTSRLRMITKQSGSKKLVVEVQSLSEPQEMSFIIDDIKLHSQLITKNWNNYTYIIPGILPKGLHNIEILFSNIYTPADILGNLDSRELTVRFRKISLE